MENAVTRWFGAQFELLHPLLQDLHRQGGHLQGTISIEFGKGIAGWIGKRLARKLGIPIDCTDCAFEVEISHTPDFLLWLRRFSNSSTMLSVFQPVGCWPDGYWIEQTGFLQLRLTVDIIEDGWYWRVLSARAGKLVFPKWLLPRSTAYKRIENGKYYFCVEFALPLLGTLVRYGGVLDVA